MSEFPSLTLKINQSAPVYVIGQRFYAVAQMLEKPKGKSQILILDKMNRPISAVSVPDQIVRMAFSPDDGLLVVVDAKGKLRGYDLADGEISPTPNRAFQLQNVPVTCTLGTSQDKTVLGVGIEKAVQLYRVEADHSAVLIQQLAVDSNVIRIEFEPEGLRVYAASHVAYFCVAQTK